MRLLILILQQAIDWFIFPAEDEVCQNSCGYVTVVSLSMRFFILFTGHHFICIQSMDGMLMFFEQESYAFGRFLPGFLLPGPLRYCARTDAFITVSSSRQVECYRSEHSLGFFFCFTF